MYPWKKFKTRSCGSREFFEPGECFDSHLVNAEGDEKVLIRSAFDPFCSMEKALQVSFLQRT